MIRHSKRPAGKAGKAWDKGVTAADLGRPLSVNPYTKGTASWWAWGEGWTLRAKRAGRLVPVSGAFNG